jgi:hypothetical protein
MVLPLLLGCEQRAATKSESKPKKARWAKGSEAANKEKAKAGEVRAVPRQGAPVRNTGGYSGGSGSSSGGGGSSYTSSGSSYSGPSRSESQAIEQIGKSIRESLDLGPTLVVWMFDRSDSANRLVNSSLTSIRSLYGSEEIANATKDDKLLTAVAGFGEKTDFLLDPPVGDAAKVKEALDAVKNEAGSREQTFAALKLTLEKYLPLRTKDRREVVIAVVTDEPGDDMSVLDDVVSITQKNAIPVFVVGPSAPLGKAVPPEPPAGGPKPPMGPDTRTYAADVLFGDWVSFSTGGYGNPESYDSGLGPWALERLCHESSGLYLAVGSVGSSYGTRLDPKVMSKYAPDYLSTKAMESSLAENKCRKALVAASQLPPASNALLNPQTIFPKRNEAEMKRMLDKAQLDAAKLEPEVNKVYDTLAGENNSVEGDRTKLTGTRWQVAYDTALGRAAAAKVRVDGYNAMLAALKRGKTFANTGSSTWLLEPADTIETGSAMQKLADKAKTYLERVQKDHPGTPWARAAEQELRIPLGWKWNEQ